MKVQLLTLGSPNLNGRTYTKEAIENSIVKAKESRDIIKTPFTVHHKFSGCADVDLSTVIGYISNIECSDTEMLGNLHTLDVPFLKDIDISKFSVRPAFVGQVSDDGVVSELELIQFAITNDPA